MTRAFPFLSNSIGAQEGDSRAAAIFPPNFSGVPQDKDALPSDSGSTSSLQSKAHRGPSYDSLADKKETPYSRSPSLRVTHKIAERKRRKEMKDLFDELKDYVPVDRGPKTSKGDILTKAVMQFQALHREREQLIEALEAAHHELNQLRQVAGNAEHAPALQQHVSPHAAPTAAAAAAAQPYLPRAADSRLHVPGTQEQHLPLRDKASDAPRTGESFLSDLRLDRLRQPSDDAVHPNFKQLEHGAVLDQSLGGARPFQPEPYQAGLVSADLPAGQGAATVLQEQRSIPREHSFDAREGAEPTNM